MLKIVIPKDLVKTTKKEEDEDWCVGKEEDEDWCAGAYQIYEPSERIIVVTDFSEKNTHDIKLATPPKGHRNKELDDTEKDTARREYSEETGVTLLPGVHLQDVAHDIRESREGPYIGERHPLVLFQADHSTDEFLDNEFLVRRGQFGDTWVPLRVAKAEGWEHEALGIHPRRREVATTMTVQQIIEDHEGKLMVPYYRRLMLPSLLEYKRNKRY